jgi:hypothetical protein
MARPAALRQSPQHGAILLPSFAQARAPAAAHLCGTLLSGPVRPQRTGGRGLVLLGSKLGASRDPPLCPLSLSVYSTIPPLGVALSFCVAGQGSQGSKASSAAAAAAQRWCHGCGPGSRVHILKLQLIWHCNGICKPKRSVQGVPKMFRMTSDQRSGPRSRTRGPISRSIPGVERSSSRETARRIAPRSSPPHVIASLRSSALKRRSWGTICG